MSLKTVASKERDGTASLRAAVALVLILAVLAVLAPVTSPPAKAQGALVCVDPGHGGSDSGAVGNGMLEKDLNMDISARLKPLLEAMGIGVVMTRESDITLSLDDRCTIANRNHADLFVSMHNNAYYADDKGTETFGYYGNQNDARLATYIHTEVIKRTLTVNRGIKQAGFYVLKHTNMTAALLEGAFITNVDDAKLLADPEFRQKIAEGTASGIYRYLNEARDFDTYILLQNPDTTRYAEVTFDYMTGDGQRPQSFLSIPPLSRRTVHVDEEVYNADVSTLVKSTNGVPIIAERTMYFNNAHGRGGHTSAGVLAPAPDWYFAEGSTAWGFSTFILVQNPGEEAADVTLSLMRSDGQVGVFQYTLAPDSRLTVDTSTLPGFGSIDFSTKVQATKPVVAERAMYFKDHRGYTGGTNSAGVNTPGTSWYLAEGHTGNGFENFVLIQNPNAAPADVLLTFTVPDGQEKQFYCRIPANTRRTVFVNELEGLGLTDESVHVVGSLPLVVERSMYFNYMGQIKEGSNSVAAARASETWYFAEGSALANFDTWLCLLNPGDTYAETFIRYMKTDGTCVDYPISIPPKSRRSVKANDVPGLSGSEFSIAIASKGPIVAEESTYFNTAEKKGGTCALGVTAPSTVWYFAEGCTR